MFIFILKFTFATAEVLSFDKNGTLNGHIWPRLPYFKWYKHLDTFWYHCHIRNKVIWNDIKIRRNSNLDNTWYIKFAKWFQKWINRSHKFSFLWQWSVSLSGMSFPLYITKDGQSMKQIIDINWTDASIGTHFTFDLVS
jgi:hypothetical protein